MSEPRAEGELPRPIDVSAALLEALDLLSPLAVSPVLISGVALAFYGVERFTKDVDLAVRQHESAALAPLLANHDPRPLRIGGLSVATASGVRVDLIDRRVDYEALFVEAIEVARRRGPLARVGDKKVPVMPLSYLIALKLLAGRPNDELDVRALLRVPQLDYAEVRAIVKKHLGAFARDYLDRFARAEGVEGAPAAYGPGDS